MLWKFFLLVGCLCIAIFIYLRLMRRVAERYERIAKGDDPPDPMQNVS
ncbi:MAG: hypothetical protein ABIG71_02395 [Candidatus Uhrbacteria bacterium]